MPNISHAHLRDAVERGIISEEQLTALVSLSTAGAAAEAALPSPPDHATARAEAPKGFNWISVAYFLGALLVLFALFWFIEDNWKRLGPRGVLGVSLVYAAIFVGTARYLLRRSFRVAGGLVTALAVAMTPLVVWAVENLTGLWVPWEVTLFPTSPHERWESGRWTIILLATVASALFALRFVRFSFLMAFVAVPLCLLAVPVSELVFPALSWSRMVPWMVLFFGVSIIALGYVVDRGDRAREGEGLAFWFYLVGLLATSFGLVHAWDAFEVGRHFFIVIYLSAMAGSLYLRQRVFLVAGAIGLFAYVVYLAAEFFRESFIFPILLAALGLGIILFTVWVQRNFPRLVERVRSDRGDPFPAVPGGLATMLIPVAISVVLLMTQYPRESRMARQQQRLQRVHGQARTRQSTGLDTVRFDSTVTDGETGATRKP